MPQVRVKYSWHWDDCSIPWMIQRSKNRRYLCHSHVFQLKAVVANNRRGEPFELLISHLIPTEAAVPMSACLNNHSIALERGLCAQHQAVTTKCTAARMSHRGKNTFLRHHPDIKQLVSEVKYYSCAVYLHRV